MLGSVYSSFIKANGGSWWRPLSTLHHSQSRRLGPDRHEVCLGLLQLSQGALVISPDPGEFSAQPAPLNRHTSHLVPERALLLAGGVEAVGESAPAPECHEDEDEAEVQRDSATFHHERLPCAESRTSG